MQVLTVQSEYVDNSLGSIPLEFSRLISGSIDIPESLWLDTGHIQLQTRIRLNLTDFQSPARGSRFLNPTSSQWGHIAMMCEGYTQSQQRLEFDNQEITIVHPEIAIYKCRNSLPRQFGKDSSSGSSHYYSINSTPVCLKMDGAIVGGTAVQLTGQGEIPTGAICLKGAPGRESYLERDPWPPLTSHAIEIDRVAEGWVDELRGVLYAYTSMVITIEVLWSTIENQAPLPVLPTIIATDAPFPIYSYSCAAGVPVPSLTNLPCDPAAVQYTDAGLPFCQLN